MVRRATPHFKIWVLFIDESTTPPPPPPNPNIQKLISEFFYLIYLI